MIITISSEKKSFTIEIKNKYTLIIGDSGTGKSRLYSMVRYVQRRCIGYSVEGLSDNYCVIAVHDDITEFTSYSGNDKIPIYFIDEDCMIFDRENIADLFLNTEGYFVIINREPMDYLPIDKTNIYCLTGIMSETVNSELLNTNYINNNISRVGKEYIEGYTENNIDDFYNIGDSIEAFSFNKENKK